MRKALIVGIDHYTDLKPLSGCVADANAVEGMLSRNADGSVNFKTPMVLTATGGHNRVDRDNFRAAVQELFVDKAEIALLYFAGHGHIDATGGFLCTSDTKVGHDGLPLDDIMKFAKASPATNKIIILDSCHSGVAGNLSGGGAELAEGMTLLTAASENQYAYEGANGAPGVFTNLMVDALNGAAANLIGEVTPGSVYAHIDQSLGTWAQRPVFKTNVKSFVSMRKATAPIAYDELRQLAKYFPEPGFHYELDPSFEPERSQDLLNDPTIPKPNPLNTAVFKVLQNYVKVNLVRPVNAPHMWHAAMESKACELTVLGEHYRRLVANDLI